MNRLCKEIYRKREQWKMRWTGLNTKLVIHFTKNQDYKAKYLE